MTTMEHMEHMEDPEARYGVCPRCGNHTLRLDRPALNALSRTDNKTYICNDCGLTEALEDVARGLSRKSKESWKAPDRANLRLSDSTP